jgi:hypothetical protein
MRSNTTRKAATTRASNCVPLQRSSSVRAAWMPRPVDAVGRHGFEGLGDGEDLHLQRDVLGDQAGGVAPRRPDARGE